jgi:hypothetical protein
MILQVLISSLRVYVQHCAAVFVNDCIGYECWIVWDIVLRAQIKKPLKLKLFRAKTKNRENGLPTGYFIQCCNYKQIGFCAVYELDNLLAFVLPRKTRILNIMFSYLCERLLWPIRPYQINQISLWARQPDRMSSERCFVFFPVSFETFRVLKNSTKLLLFDFIGIYQSKSIASSSQQFLPGMLGF